MNKLILITVFVLAACARSNSATPTAPGDLSTLSTADVLLYKYDRAVVTCNLWSAKTPAAKPQDVLHLDLKKEELPAERGLAFSNSEHSILVILDFQAPVVLKTLTVDGQYELKNTVSVPFTYSYQGSTKNVYESGESKVEAPLYEKVSNMLFSSGAAYTDRVDCTIDTAIKPQYAGDFAKVK